MTPTKKNKPRPTDGAEVRDMVSGASELLDIYTLLASPRMADLATLKRVPVQIPTHEEIFRQARLDMERSIFEVNAIISDALREQMKP